MPCATELQLAIGRGFPSKQLRRSRVYGACRIDNSEARRSEGLERPYLSSDILIALNTQLADASKMRKPGSVVFVFATGGFTQACYEENNIK